MPAASISVGNEGMQALCILTDGFEEVEAITPIDYLRRAGVQLTIASQSDSLSVRGRSDIVLQAEVLLEKVKDEKYDLLLIPGGPGVKALKEDMRVLKMVQDHDKDGRLIAAICAAPTVLQAAGVLKDKEYTAHHSVSDCLPEIVEDASVVRDEHIITSRGAGTALPFALAIVETLFDEDKAIELAESTHA